jgi:hypothetical protein
MFATSISGGKCFLNVAVDRVLSLTLLPKVFKLPWLNVLGYSSMETGAKQSQQ